MLLISYLTFTLSNSRIKALLHSSKSGTCYNELVCYICSSSLELPSLPHINPTPAAVLLFVLSIFCYYILPTVLNNIIIAGMSRLHNILTPFEEFSQLTLSLLCYLLCFSYSSAC